MLSRDAVFVTTMVGSTGQSGGSRCSTWGRCGQAESCVYGRTSLRLLPYGGTASIVGTCLQSPRIRRTTRVTGISVTGKSDSINCQQVLIDFQALSKPQRAIGACWPIRWGYSCGARKPRRSALGKRRSRDQSSGTGAKRARESQPKDRQQLCKADAQVDDRTYTRSPPAKHI